MTALNQSGLFQTNAFGVFYLKLLSCTFTCQTGEQAVGTETPCQEAKPQADTSGGGHRAGNEPSQSCL